MYVSQTIRGVYDRLQGLPTHPAAVGIGRAGLI